MSQVQVLDTGNTPTELRPVWGEGTQHQPGGQVTVGLVSWEQLNNHLSVFCPPSGIIDLQSVCVVPADDQTVNSILALNLVLSWSVQRVDKHSFFIPATNQELAGRPRQAPRSFRDNRQIWRFRVEPLRRKGSDHLTMGRGFPCTVQNSLMGVFSHTVWGRRAMIKSGILGISSKNSTRLVIMSLTWRGQTIWSDVCSVKLPPSQLPWESRMRVTVTVR